MARRPRFNIADYPQHIVQRGHNRLECFFEPSDYAFYLESLQAAAHQYQCEIHAYALLPDQVQMLATPRIQKGVSQMMQSLGRRYVQYINHRYHRSGTLWEGRYRSSLVDSYGYLLTCSRYIETLPVRRQLADLPDDYAWTSYHNHTRGEDNDLLTAHPVYLGLGDTPEERQSAYLDLFQYEIHPSIITYIEETVNVGLVLGGDHFKHRMSSLLDMPVVPKRRGRPPKQASGD